jgi:hypothetical protein
MSLFAVDQMIEFSVAILATGDRHKMGSLVRDLATRWPEEKAQAVCFALTSAAATVEEVSTTTDRSTPPSFGYKLSALVAADIFAIEALGRSPALGRDLLHFWRRVDPFFLDQ